MRLIQMPGNLEQGDVRRFLDQSQDFLGMGFNPVRAIIPALPTGPNMTRLSPLIDPGLVFCPPAEHREPMSGLAIPFSMWQCAGHGDAAGPGFVR